GEGIIELAVGLIVLLPVLLMIFDLVVVAITVQINDSTAREAARVASQGDPKQATQRAQAIVARANKQVSGLMSNFQLVSVTFNPADILAQEDAMGTYGGLLKGSVTVETQVDVRPFVVQYAYGGKSPIQFHSKQTFPLSYAVPNTTGGP